MKKHIFLSTALLLLTAACANEDITQQTTDTDSDNNKNLTTFVTGEEPKSRTSMDYDTGAFFWEAGDYIYVKDDDGAWQKSSNAPTSKTAYFKFKVPGKFSANSTYKVYYPGKGGSNDQVRIRRDQTQTAINNTAHLGESGDCGIADANKVTGSKAQFEFKLDHKPAILVFQPYTSNTILKNCYLKKIEVTSDNNIMGTYTLDPTTGELKNGTLTGKQIILAANAPIPGHSNENGFPLNTTAASVTTNGAYMVIKPGTHTLRVRYWVKDLATKVEGTITKNLPSFNYTANTYYDMPANLDVKNYPLQFYMWDAQKPYWYGHEWDKADYVAGVDQPRSYDGIGSAYPEYTDPLRYYNESFPGYNIQNDAVQPHFANVPNVNEMCWYISDYGDPRWDDELWTTMGHLQTGGLWVLKKAEIPRFSDSVSPDGAYRHYNPALYNNTNILDIGEYPIGAGDADKYFFLPSFRPYFVGHGTGIAMYWTSSAYPGHIVEAYSMQFCSSFAAVEHPSRDLGCVVQAFE